ncbi:Arginine biosynthesis bifunctional protein ArgJ beta chain [Mollisia scopiformis]|uniref:Arginine biosynthesis bifunctional protein ArgJ, mitochondrial n=1 Tax=Mollisia scopiformis TaxID=149040 RepID=A0A132BAH9_MOLSC|nr:Arginine biosynthesis bifunctional protein ArgJ beta chain [Mollisia scopiformis]KUJ09396.1 Arginine biosynthesis bifunctional protein ArgJ beta chain [Mollisia scopiformis]
MSSRTELSKKSPRESFPHSAYIASQSIQEFVPTSGTYPKGFQVGSINVGIKPASKSQPDLVLVASEKPSNGAAVFTKNEFPNASITVSKEIVRRTKGWGVRGVIANSWCGNTITGKQGLEDSLIMSKEAGRYISGETTDAEAESSVMVMHTGMGGQRLPINNIIKGIPTLHASMGNSHTHWLEAARGLSTTDTFPKLVSRTFTLPSSPTITYSIAGLTKGSGMIHPNMATTLGIICTDASISAPALQNCYPPLPRNRGPEISLDSSCEDFISFQRILVEFMADMAKLVVRDGEGATKFITIRVHGAPSYAAGKHIASVIARSVLFKTGIYGKEPNWGNVVAALGYSLMNTGKGIIVGELTSVSFVAEGGEVLKFMERGVLGVVDEQRAKEVMEKEDVEVLVELRDDGKEDGGEEAVYWTCDLTHEFVTINSDFGN